MHHRTPSRPQARPLAIGTLASATCLVAGVAFAGPALAAAAPNTVFTIGVGESPSVAVSPDGTAYVAFDHNQNVSSDDDTVQLCRIPRGHRGCASLTTVALPDLGVGGAGPKVSLPAPGTVQIISSRQSQTTTTNDLIYTVTSTDGGATFGAPTAIGTSGVTAPSTVVLGNRYVSISSSNTAGSFVEAYGPAGTAPDVGAAPISPDEYGGTLAVTSTGTLLAAHYDSPAGTPNVVTVQRYAGSGPVSSPGSWTPVFTTAGDLTQLASGPSGTYLFDRRDSDGRYEVRKWTGSGLGSAALVSPGHDDEAFPTFSEDANGRLDLAYRRSGDLVIESSFDGVHFTPLRTLAPDSSSFSVYNPKVAEAADGGGFVAFDSDGDGKVYAVAVPLIRQISGKVTHGTIAGADKGAVKGQPVLLQQLGKHGYVTVASSKFQAHGGYSFAVPKHKAKITLRVLAPAVEGYALDQSKPVIVKA